jgi:FkbM family methyltransferase
MLIKVQELVGAWAIRPTGVIHVGAHAAEESSEYQRYGWRPVIWIEANPMLIDRLKTIVPKEDSVICAALWDEDELSLDFNVANNGESSSFLQPVTHLIEHPDIKFETKLTLSTKRLDSILTDIPKFLNLDVQGAELHVLRGLGKLIESLDYIYTEINDEELYKDCAKLRDLDCFLEMKGFARVCLRRNGRSGWGDAFYVRKEFHLRQSPRITIKTFYLYLRNSTYDMYASIHKFIFRTKE